MQAPANPYFISLQYYNMLIRQKHIIDKYQATVSHVVINRTTKRIPMPDHSTGKNSLDAIIQKIECDFCAILDAADLEKILAIPASTIPITPFLREEGRRNYLRAELVDFLWDNYVEIE
ncbi:hypothetical protein PVA45_07265 (plasmid) [Entomospira entomophila]|uniref:Uncharacterized protein n=2 Tax=Entomospira entomophila TaxID=2719988 RepID=A0A968KTE1_9SPIO|nr:hypothetical protein [Entomospira entomophilus]NIZ41342.1 hypothetical protein [Entomospira entomophilus]WDI36247.1 hypothetical protein PVA45_07265 [Entomospira entomophilus]